MGYLIDSFADPNSRYTATGTALSRAAVRTTERTDIAFQYRPLLLACPSAVSRKAILL